MSVLTPQYSTNRMVGDYTDRYYINAHGLGESLLANDLHEARDLSAHVRRYREHWAGVRVRSVRSDVRSSMPLHEPVTVEASIDLGGLNPDELAVQLYAGTVNALGALTQTEVSAMDFEREEDGSHVFVGSFTPRDSGRKGFTVRVIPNDARLVGTLVPGLITWDREAPTGPLGAPKAPSKRHAMV